MKYTSFLFILSGMTFFTASPTVADSCYKTCSDSAWACKVVPDPTGYDVTLSENSIKGPHSCEACYMYQLFISPKCTLENQEKNIPTSFNPPPGFGC